VSTRIAIDMGNTETAVALFDRETIVGVRNVRTERFAGSGGARGLLDEALAALGAAGKPIEGSVVATVVPAHLADLVGALSRLHEGEPLVVGPSIDLGVRIGYERPEELGPDRIADAVAGFAEAKGAVIVVDLGTATTFNAVTEDGVFLGGAIAPGIRTGADALARRTARIARAELVFPERALGTSTDEAVRSGILWGAVAMIDGMVTRIRDEMGGGLAIATGGLAALVAPRSRAIDRADPLLTLKGLKLLYERNRSSRPPAPRA